MRDLPGKLETAACTQTSINFLAANLWFEKPRGILGGNQHGNWHPETRNKFFFPEKPLVSYPDCIDFPIRCAANFWMGNRPDQFNTRSQPVLARIFAIH